MHVNEINVMRRKNLGNYEHFEVALKASLDENDSFEDSYTELLENLRKAMNPQGNSNAKTEKPEAPKAATAKPAPKKATKKAPAKKKAPEEEVTMEELMQLCRDTANRLGSADKVKELIKTACGVDNLKDASASTFGKLKTLLEEA